ncbi:MAG: hypothetical protein J0M20_17295 [Burkholderiales bacterium]|nr:hypothetical protein [Burkholderiales bacterium]
MRAVFRFPPLATLVVMTSALQAAPRPADEGPRGSTIYRCEGGGTPTYSDSAVRCDNGAVLTNPKPSPVPVVGPVTGKLTLSGPPCPLPMTDPEGAAWSPIRACYRQALAQQAENKVGEAQLAGVLMGVCETETQALVQGNSAAAVLGSTPDERRAAIRRWALWLVQQSGRAVDSVPVQALKLGKAVPLQRLGGPMELQLPSGQITEALPGTLLRQGDQLFVRRGLSLQVAGQSLPGQSRDRCVRID